eukprot:s2735_g6.t1
MWDHEGVRFSDCDLKIARNVRRCQKDVVSWICLQPLCDLCDRFTFLLHEVHADLAAVLLPPWLPWLRSGVTEFQTDMARLEQLQEAALREVIWTLGGSTRRLEAAFGGARGILGFEDFVRGLRTSAA